MRCQSCRYPSCQCRQVTDFFLLIAGFTTGQPVQVSIEHGQLIIRLVENN
ncbi:type I toxin-antitoxin system SymE family toxin [Xenorhabdus bovienii]|nr:type I toxin-antitoxin system SymE family toxin [Xenorhabdus bovienii]